MQSSTILLRVMNLLDLIDYDKLPGEIQTRFDNVYFEIEKLKQLL